MITIQAERAAIRTMPGDHLDLAGVLAAGDR
jgi:hypothetical protein